MDYHLLLVGCGKMGRALLAGWTRAGVARRVDVVEPAAPKPDGAAVPWLPPGMPGRVVAVPEALPDGLRPDAVVIAVKPQVLDSAVPAYCRLVRPETVFLSIAAGKTLATLQRLLGGAAAVVRSMPNTPAAVGRGMSVLVAGSGVGPAQRLLCHQLLAAVGEVAWVEDEALLDPVTALSGSGPAYVFLLIETLARAGRSAGLPAELAMRLARETVIGAGALAAASDEDAVALRRAVTSPGGTTAAALDVLMADDGLQPLFDRAVAAAARRSRDLAG